MFLKALGVGLTAPMALRLSQLALAAPERPRRLFSFYIAHGAPPEHLDPMGGGRNFSLEGNGVGIFGTLEPYKALTTVLRGLEIKGHNNHAAIGSVLTDDAERSIDHEVARGLGSTAMVLGAIPHRPFGIDHDSRVSRDGEWISPELSPVRAYDTAFAGLEGADPGTNAPNDAALRARVMQLTARELEDLQGELRGLTREESKLSRHLEAVQRIETEERDAPPGGVVAPACTAAPSLPSVDALRGQDDAFFISDENFGPIAEAQVDVGAQALLCGATRVVTLHSLYGTAQVPFGHIGIPEGHHDPLSHSQTEQGREQFARCQRWMFGLVARAAEILDVPDPEDPDHTALENSLLFAMSEIADGNGHLSSKGVLNIGAQVLEQWIPAIMVGGAGGTVDAGQVLELENRAHGDALLTIARAMGVPLTRFGVNGTQPIAEILL